MTPRQWQYLSVTVVIVVAALLQGVVAARLPIPGPPLGICLVVVIAIGMAAGTNVGAVSGFSAGLLLDVLPPAQTAIGITALSLLVVGALSGRVPDPRGLAPVQLAGIAAALGASGWVAAQGLLWVLGYPTAPWTFVLWFTFGVTALSVLLVPGITWLLRRVGSPRGRSRSRRDLVSPR